MFFSRGLGKDHERRAAQPFLVSNTKCTVRRGVWSTASGVASVPSSSFFAGLVQDPPSLFLHNHDLSTRFIHQPNPILFLPLSYRSSSFPPPSRSPPAPSSPIPLSPPLVSPAPGKFVRSKLLATISTSARLRLDIDIHRRMSPLEYSLLEAASRASSSLPTRAFYPALARSLARFGPLAAPFLLDLPFRGRSSSRYAAQYCKQPAKRTFARMQTVHRPPVTAFYISPWWRADASCIRPRTTRNPSDPRPDEESWEMLLKYSDGITVYTEEETSSIRNNRERRQREKKLKELSCRTFLSLSTIVTPWNNWRNVIWTKYILLIIYEFIIFECVDIRVFYLFVSDLVSFLTNAINA